MIASHQELLKQTSRSFYLTLRVLPQAVRPQIALAYLLARTTDTIADTEVLPAQERLNALGLLRARIFGHTQTPLDFGKLAQHQGSSAERTLLERAEVSLALLRTLRPGDLALVRKVIDTITSGQELDLLRFESGKNQLVETPALTSALSPTESGQLTRIISLQTDAELDDYTYRVAGCVGEFWTRMCRAHLFPAAKLDDARLLQEGVRFGKGLQLVNILRDLPRDLAQGRCYIPSESLATAGLKAADLVDPNSERRFRPVYDGLLDQAEAHLASGWSYTNALPANQLRVRLACALPILLGVRTVARLREGKVLDPAHRIKVSRAEVKDLLLRTLVHLPWPSLFRDLWRPKQKPGA
jgi:farnesyl-diphosphate farnesyltransferase